MVHESTGQTVNLYDDQSQEKGGNMRVQKETHSLTKCKPQVSQWHFLYTQDEGKKKKQNRMKDTKHQTYYTVI